MTLKRRLSITLLCCFLPLLSVIGGQETVQLKFTDSYTGWAIQPSHLLLLDAQTQKTTDIVQQIAWAEQGAKSLTLETGLYWLSATLPEYNSVTFKLSVLADENHTINVFLTPKTAPEKLRESFLDARRHPDQTILTGYVVDDETGAPIQNATIINTAGSQQGQTDQDGYFLMHLPASEAENTIIVEKEGFTTEIRSDMTLWGNGDIQYRFRLKMGNGINSISENKAIRASQQKCEDCESEHTDHAETALNNHQNEIESADVSVVIPNTIRVGRNCSNATNCTSVEVYDIDTYCKLILPAEWFSCWGSLTDGMNSLRAGSVAIRSYAVWHIYHPVGTTYDICDNTFCQALGSTQTANANNAVDQTTTYVIVTGSNNILRAEYSAENNNKGCGNGWSGTGSSWPCINDQICVNQTPNGHGRGMCQWGSARWANGSVISLGSPCSSGPAYGSNKDWLEILAHYYPGYDIVEGVSAAIQDLAAVPSIASPGETIQLEYTFTATPSFDLILGGGIARDNTGAWVIDLDNASKITASSGSNTLSRDYDIANGSVLAEYDLLGRLWYDLDENNVINPGDQVLDLQVFENKLTLQPAAITPVDGELPTAFRLAQNYPNPFNPSTTINFSLAKSARVTLKVFDGLGKQVAILVNESLSAGSYDAQWNAENLAAGVYFYRLSAYNGKAKLFETTQKLILAK